MEIQIFYLLKYEYVQLYAQSMQLYVVGKKNRTESSELLCKRNIQ